MTLTILLLLSYFFFAVILTIMRIRKCKPRRHHEYIQIDGVNDGDDVDNEERGGGGNVRNGGGH